MLTLRSPLNRAKINHDLCWPLALADQVERNSAGSGWAYRIVETPPQRDTLWEFGLQPYQTFYSSVTGFSAPSIEKGFHLHTQWSHLGVSVLEIMSEPHSIPTRADQAGHQRVPSTHFNRVAAAALATIKSARLEQHVCVVVIAHRLYPEISSGFLVEWRRLLRLISETHPLVVLTGHTHEADTGPLGGPGPLGSVRGLGIVGVPHSESVPIDTLVLPRVGYITLENLGTPRLQCEIARMQKRERQSWTPEAPIRFRMESNRHWVSADA
jgi:hypothetical protein